ncbi:MAG: acetyl-CoA carboxylase biotin carboxyl carrier protein [Frankia sp.]|nr:acetyl-CoA carboxylase biotin carboxyl carrier protein [Frankia sp.]
MAGEQPSPWAQALVWVELFGEHGLTELTVERPGLRVALSASATGPAPAAAHEHGAGQHTAAGGQAGAAQPPAPGQGLDPPPAGAVAGPGERERELVEVTAPMLGVFYRRPSPQAPPFVVEDDEVGPDTTVAIIEVMKLMNAVTAGVAGRVVAVCVDDGELVEYGQPLFLLEPLAPGAGG